MMADPLHPYLHMLQIETKYSSVQLSKHGAQLLETKLQGARLHRSNVEIIRHTKFTNLI